MTARCLDVTALTTVNAPAQALAAAHAAVATAARVVRQGGLVVFPTETFYGLAAAPQHQAAIDRLVALKGRAPHKPFALIAASLQACAVVAVMPPAMVQLAEAFWPGPLTLLLDPAQRLSPHLLGESLGQCGAASAKVGLRVSSHPVAQALSHAAGGLITATSANLTGQPAAALCAALVQEMWASTDFVLDGGPLTGGRPSTVVGLNAAGALDIVRPGAIGGAALRQVLKHQADTAPSRSAG